VPLVPASPVLAKLIIQSSLFENGFVSELSTLETVILKYPEYSTEALNVKRINFSGSNNFVIIK